MDTELLKTFVEVTQTRHFGRAAERLFITPAAVSARIRQLEQVLGVSLFYRTRGDIRTTAEGQRLLPHAHRLLQGWADARRDLAQEAEVASQVRIGATPALWHFALANLWEGLASAFPGLAVRAEAYSQKELGERLLADQLDLVVVYDPPEEGRVKARRLGQLALTLLSNTPGLSLKQALVGDYLYVDWGVAFELFHARRLGNVASRLYTNQASIALSALSGRAGTSAYLPESLTTEQLQPVVGAPGFNRPLYAVFPAEREFDPTLQQVMALLEESLG